MQLAWQALAELFPEATVNSAESADRALLREVWSEQTSRSGHAEQGLIDVPEIVDQRCFSVDASP